MTSILIANRGEIALRIAQAASELHLNAVSIYPSDDADSAHVVFAEQAVEIGGRGPAAYLDGAAVIAAAKAAGCDAIHPGYGFLSEDAEFAAQIAAAGLVFIGPSPETLRLLGDKAKAVDLAQSCGVPVTRNLPVGMPPDQIADFLSSCAGGIVLKAVLGGGGRGMRIVTNATDLATAIAEVQAEAAAAFGSDAFYVEEYHAAPRHIEVQVIGDGHSVSHLWERDCSVQRLHQKMIEIAPAPNLPEATRSAMLSAACTMAQQAGLRGLATFEFLLLGDGSFVFMESNPRLQVEHTITEEITGIDLVQAQIRIALGETLADLGLAQQDIPAPRGSAVQLRINCEQFQTGGTVTPTGGTLTAYAPRGGLGLRVEAAAYVGMKTNPAYDSLLGKLIAHSPAGLPAALTRAHHGLAGFRLDGVQTTKPILARLLDCAELETGQATTNLIGALWQECVAIQAASTPTAQPAAADGFAAPMQGTILSVAVTAGEVVAKGTLLFTMEAMKMQHRITAPYAAEVSDLYVTAGDTVFQGDPLAKLSERDGTDVAVAEAFIPDPDHIRPDLARLTTRRAMTADEARPAAVEKRHAKGKRTARENVVDLCDTGSFVEYGDLTYAAQRKRRSLDDLMANTPADGMITGFGTVNNGQVTGQTRTAVMAYDYTVLAGTQGVMNHKKTDRLLHVIRAQKTPLVIYCEGGGGRPGDVDAMDNAVAGLDVPTFWSFAALSGLVPVIGIGSGRVFAGNAALLGCCDVVIATKDSSIGMGGPAMIEGGGLGVFHPDAVGPADVHGPNGVIDILVEDEAEATKAAAQYLSYFQGATLDWTAPDSRTLRHVVPENRLEVYDVHAALHGICDAGSVLELRTGFARGMVTAFGRVEGRPVGILANNPMHLAGAIDSDGADKAARFVKLCDAFDIPLVTLCDTPGMMVGPEVEKTALVRHCSRLFLAAGNATIPMMTVVLRKGYGLGAMVMAGGSFHRPLFTVAWPTGEFGGMGLEGAVRLGYRKELEAIADLDARQALYDKLVADSYEKGEAQNAAACLEIDTVIDPADTRKWIAATLDGVAPVPARDGKKHAYVDAW